ncbi:MAG: LysE family transporter, partial [Rhodospirillaceae bacterium]|nr:LysE family transporter [Rhodospirillaceae bacterium]
MSSIIAMCAFSLAMSVSPGPVNLITLAIGVNRGLREAIPFVSGATIGFTLLLMLVGLGLGELAVRFSPLLNGTNYVGAAIIFFMGYKIATSSSQIELIDDAAPFMLDLLDWSLEDVHEYIETNSNNDFVTIKYSYKELGRSEAWFKKQCRSLQNRMDKIKREILLEWTKTTESSIFEEEDLMRLEEYAIDDSSSIFIN